jgi:hypothetical protein
VGAGLGIGGRRGPAADVVVFTTSAHAVDVTTHHDAAFMHSALLQVAAEPSGVDDHDIPRGMVRACCVYSSF